MGYPTGVTQIKSAGRIKDGDELFVLKVPELEGKYRFEKIIARTKADGTLVAVVRTAGEGATAGTPGSYGDERILQNEYFRIYTGWANLTWKDFITKMVDSKVFASEAELNGQYQINSRFPLSPTQQETNYVIDADGVITRSAKPATSEDYQKAQDQQNNLLSGLVNNLNPNGGSTTGGTATTATQKAVRVGIVVVVVGVVIWAATKLFGKKKR